MTEEQIKQYHEKVDENIRKHGYHSTFVFSDFLTIRVMIMIKS